MDSLHIDEEILFRMLENERDRQNGEPFSDCTLEMQEAYNKVLAKLAKNDVIEAQLENDLVDLTSSANLDGFHSGVRTAIRLIRTLSSL